MTRTGWRRVRVRAHARAHDVAAALERLGCSRAQASGSGRRGARRGGRGLGTAGARAAVALPCSASACGRGGVELVRPWRRPGGRARWGGKEGRAGGARERQSREGGENRARGVGEREREREGEGKEEKKKMGKRKEKGGERNKERERASALALIAVAVGHAWCRPRATRRPRAKQGWDSGRFGCRLGSSGYREVRRKMKQERDRAQRQNKD